MDIVISPAGPLQGALTLPPDKAVCHRAVLVASIADGHTTIHPWPSAEDCQRTLEVVQRLGVSTERSSHGLVIHGCGRDGLRAATQELFCGESGTTFRLAAGLLAGQPFTSVLRAGPGLSRRPMRRIVEPLSRMGARVEGALLEGHAQERCPPLTIHGTRPLKAVRYHLPVASAQVKSAVLLAGLFADGPSTVIEPAPTRDHTERMLRCFGVRVDQAGADMSVTPGPLTSPREVAIPGDVSSAAFFLVAASCVPGSQLTLRRVGLNPTRTGLLTILERMGGSIRVTEDDDAWEPCGTLLVEARTLRATTVEPGEVPGVIDELPILMVAAASAKGTTRFRGLGELRVKETDRIQSMLTGLKQLGVRIRLPAADAVDIEGGTLIGGVVESAGDHRTAMSLAVAGLAAQGRTTIRGAECVAKSFPDFFEQLRAVAGSATGKSVDKP